MFNNKYVSTFINAGLTKTQSKIFMILVTTGPINIKNISKLSQIDRSNVYKVVKQLEELELVEKFIGNPTLYKSIPLQIAIATLTSRKKQKLLKLQNEFEQFAKSISVFNHNEVKKQKDFFKIIPSGTNVFCRQWEITLKKSKYSVDIVASEYREPKDSPVWDIYIDLLTSGVKVRWIIDRSTKNDNEFMQRIKQFQHLFDFPTIKMKICYDCIRPFGALLDNKILIIFLDESLPMKHSRTLWTNNRQLIQNFKEHFENNWKFGVSHLGKIKN